MDLTSITRSACILGHGGKRWSKSGGQLEGRKTTGRETASVAAIALESVVHPSRSLPFLTLSASAALTNWVGQRALLFYLCASAFLATHPVQQAPAWRRPTTIVAYACALGSSNAALKMRSKGSSSRERPGDWRSYCTAASTCCPNDSHLRRWYAGTGCEGRELTGQKIRTARGPALKKRRARQHKHVQFNDGSRASLCREVTGYLYG